MIDKLLKYGYSFHKPSVWIEVGLKSFNYIIITLHRPSNVDDVERLKCIMQEIIENTQDLQLVFPVHPRTFKIIKNLGIVDNRLHMIEPLGYLEFNYLVERSKAVITDSGGISEETTVMGIPCMTLRNSTERPETIDVGTNELLGVNPNAIKPALEKLFSGNWKKGAIPKLWDGKSSERIVKQLIELI